MTFPNRSNTKGRGRALTNFERHRPLRLYRAAHHMKAARPPRGAVQLDVERVCRERGIVVERGPYRGRANLRRLGRLTGLSYVTLYNLLRRPGRPQGVSLDTLTRLCEALECKPGDLFVYTPIAPLVDARESYHYGAQPLRLRLPDDESGDVLPDRTPPQAAIDIPWDDFETAS